MSASAASVARTRATAAPAFAVARRRLCAACRRHVLLSSPLTSAHLSSRAIPTGQREQSTAAQAVAAAQTLFSDGRKAESQLAPLSVDPSQVVGKEMKSLTENIRRLLESGDAELDAISNYYAQSEGKRIRPLIVLLMSRAIALAPKQRRHGAKPLDRDIDTPISPYSQLSDVNLPGDQESKATKPRPSDNPQPSDILPSQLRLAEITELIHTASLLHDDVVDHAESRRSAPSANVKFGYEMALLAGDFLLGRASAAIGRLHDTEVVELLGTVISNLAEGEVLQRKNTVLAEPNPKWTEDRLDHYIKKTYLKSASLISKSCCATALLGESAPVVVRAAYAYGMNLGVAFQLVDDMLDYTVSEKELGKPAGADLQLGLATAPLIFAWKDKPELGALVGRKFSGEGDAQRARELVLGSNGLEQTRLLAQEFAEKAIDAIEGFPDSGAKDGLIKMCIRTIQRRR